MNLYLLNIQKVPFTTVTMLTHYKCQENFTPEPNIYRGWTVEARDSAVIQNIPDVAFVRWCCLEAAHVSMRSLHSSLQP